MCFTFLLLVFISISNAINSQVLYERAEPKQYSEKWANKRTNHQNEEHKTYTSKSMKENEWYLVRDKDKFEDDDIKRLNLKQSENDFITGHKITPENITEVYNELPHQSEGEILKN